MSQNNFIPALNSHLRSIMMFLTVGALTAAINVSIFSFLWGLLNVNYQVATSIAYIFAVIFHFIANRRFTFKSQQANIGTQARKYLVMVFVNYLTTMMVMHFSVAWLGLSPYTGIILAICATIGTGYVMARFWVFHLTTPGG